MDSTKTKPPRASAEDVKAAAAGRWKEILTNVAGIDGAILDGRGYPCPRCGGDDRFALVDESAGAVICRHCFSERNGDGLAAVGWSLDLDFPASVNRVAEYLGLHKNGTSTRAASTRTKPSSTSTRVVQRIERIASTVEAEKPLKPAGKVFSTAAAAIADLERRHGPRSQDWTYHDADGQPVGVIVRWDLADGKKDIRPVSRHGDGWRIGGMPEPRPLYGLPDLAGAARIYVPEGEKATDAARAIGLTATTSPHGAQSADKCDWSPLAGTEVIIMPDNDEAGERYADDVTAILRKLVPAPTIKVVRLPDLPEAGDIVDWVEGHGEAAEPDDLRREIEALADAAEPVEAEAPPEVPAVYMPFPVPALPEPLRGFVTAAAKAIGCDSSYIALPLLAVVAAAIGTARRLQLKRGWSVPTIIWAAIVGESGTSKTPAFKQAMKALRERQGKALERHAEALRQHEADLAHYERDLAEWKKSKAGGEPPEKPVEPQAERCVIADATVEALAPLLLANPRGLLMARDELAGWIGSFDRYSGKGGADSAHWLSMHNGESIIVDRKTGVPKTIYVPQAAVCVCGGIQPGILNRALGTEHRESGLAARLLLACPPRMPKRWTEADIDPAAEADIARLVERLYELQPAAGDGERLQPVVIGLTPEAKAAWKGYYNAHGQEQADLSGDLSAAWSKLEEYAARFALVIHYVRWAAGDSTLGSVNAVDVVSMSAGIRLATWFKGEARRVYAMLGETDGDRDQRRLVEWISRKGGAVTAREVLTGCRWLRESGAAEAALNDLVKAGLGGWQTKGTTPKGGRPAHVFTLSALSAVSTTPVLPEESMSFAYADTADSAQTDSPDDDWGDA